MPRAGEKEKVGIIGHDDYNKKLKWIHYSSKDQRRIDLKLVFISFCSNQLSLIFLWVAREDEEPITNS